MIQAQAQAQAKTQTQTLIQSTNLADLNSDTRDRICMIYFH